MTTLKNIISQRTGVRTFASPASPSTGQSLQKSLHLSHPDKIEFKKISSPSENKKYATAQPDIYRDKSKQTMTRKTQADSDLQTRWTRTPAANSVLPQLAVTCKNEAEYSYQTFVQVESEVLRNRQLRQHANRSSQPKKEKMFEEIKKMIAKDDIEGAINKLEGIVNTNSIRNELYSLSGKYYQLKNDYRKGLSTNEDTQVPKSRLRLAILELIDKISEDSEMPSNNSHLNLINELEERAENIRNVFYDMKKMARQNLEWYERLEDTEFLFFSLHRQHIHALNNNLILLANDISLEAFSVLNSLMEQNMDDEFSRVLPGIWMSGKRGKFSSPISDYMNIISENKKIDSIDERNERVRKILNNLGLRNKMTYQSMLPPKSADEIQLEIHQSKISRIESLIREEDIENAAKELDYFRRIFPDYRRSLLQLLSKNYDLRKEIKSGILGEDDTIVRKQEIMNLTMEVFDKLKSKINET